MRWPWQRSNAATARLAYRLAPAGVAWVLADEADGQLQVLRCGVVARDAADATWRQLSPRPAVALGLLELADYQLLQVDAPAVPADELRAAARWRIRDMVDTHVDDVTIDVMRVGRPRAGANQPLFVVAARNAAVSMFGPDSVPAKARPIRSKVRNAQEAHEAIRPVDFSRRTAKGLGTNAERLYDLVWRRTVASQMVDATVTTTTRTQLPSGVRMLLRINEGELTREVERFGVGGGTGRDQPDFFGDRGERRQCRDGFEPEARRGFDVVSRGERVREEDRIEARGLGRAGEIGIVTKIGQRQARG